MLREDFINELKIENEELQFQLKDLEYLIQLKEEELADLKKTSQNIIELQSKLDQNLYQFEQMQNFIGNQQQQAEGALRREASMEEEMIDSMKAEKSYYEIREEFKSNKLALNDLNQQMNEAVALYHQITDLKNKITSLQSDLEISNLDNKFLKEELFNYKNQTPS